MPFAIGVAILGAELAGTEIVAGLTLGSLVGTTLLAGGSLALSALLRPDQNNKTAAEQQTVKQSLPQRQMAVGRVKLGGAFFFYESADGTLVQGIVHCEGPIDAYEQWWLSDTNTHIASGSLGGTNTADPWGPNVIIESHLGATNQAASPVLLATFPTSWTSAHHLYGLAYSVVQYTLPSKPAKNFQKVYPNGAPTLRIVARTVKVFDPRATGQSWADPTSWTWSNNAGLVVLWYLTHPRGMNIAQSRMNLASFSAFATLSDQSVTLKAGGTVKRYMIGLAWDETDEPRTVLGKMLDACDAMIVTLQDGTLGIRGGQWVAPSVTLTAADLLGYEYQESDAKLSAFNSLKITYCEPNSDYQQVEGDPWDDTADIALRGTLAQDFSCEAAQSHSQARRLAKIRMHKGNPKHQLTLTTKLPGLLVVGEDTIILDIPELGIDEAFRVTSFVPSDDLATCTIGVSSFDATAYAWDPATEEGTPPAYATSTRIRSQAPLPTNLDIEPVRTTVSGSAVVIKARATALHPTDSNAQYWVLAGRYRKAGDTAWITMDPDSADPDAVETNILADGGAYEIQERYEGLGTVSAWTATQTFTAVADDTAPAMASGLGASASGSTATITWTNPNSSNFASARVYRGALTSFASATLVKVAAGAPSSAGSWTDTGLASGTYRYFVTAANGSGTESTQIGPATVTI